MSQILTLNSSRDITQIKINTSYSYKQSIASPAPIMLEQKIDYEIMPSVLLFFKTKNDSTGLFCETSRDGTNHGVGVNVEFRVSNPVALFVRV
jgi:hypothetical protein